jgi:hypothetical protein
MTTLSNTVIIRDDCIVFQILDTIIRLYSEKLDYGVNTVAELDDKFYYLGSELPTIGSAIFAWEYINNRSLTEVEFKQVLMNNNIL